MARGGVHSTAGYLVSGEAEPEDVIKKEPQVVRSAMNCGGTVHSQQNWGCTVPLAALVSSKTPQQPR